MKETTTITEQDIKRAIDVLNSYSNINEYEQMSWKEFVELMANSKHIPVVTTPKVQDSWKFIKNKK